jgi:uncharacterized membrane protein
MTKFEYISELESLLLDVSDDERLEAIQFYENYFEDAGEDKEQSIIAELGSPQKVAEGIKADLLTNWQEAKERGYFTENGYKDESTLEPKFEIIHGTKSKEETENIFSTNTENEINRDSKFDDTKRNDNFRTENSKGYYSKSKNYNNSNSNNSSLKVFLIILLFIFAIPVGIPILATVFGLLVSVIATVFCIWLAFAITSAALIISGIIVIFVGIVKLITIPAVGIFLAGSGLIVFGVGLLFTMATIGISSKLFPLIPEVFRWFINLCRLPFRNRRVEA